MAALAGPGLASLITDEAGVKAPVVENVEVREEEEVLIVTSMLEFVSPLSRHPRKWWKLRTKFHSKLRRRVSPSELRLKKPEMREAYLGMR